MCGWLLFYSLFWWNPHLWMRICTDRKTWFLCSAVCMLDEQVKEDVFCWSPQCSIDLKKNLLVIGTTGTETRFLSEAELPECARLAYGAEGREDARPGEIADRELAEALQRSIQESGEELESVHGTTFACASKSFLLSFMQSSEC